MNSSGEDKNKTVGGLLFVGCLFLGIGIGMYLEDVKIGTMIGLGVGFLVMAATRLKSDK
ncbi:MAG: hypothetical protein JKY52_15345 [Flavobacteriales bacterium]|nr:hypothetical protein [Flavobacteriales bacterium]